MIRTFPRAALLLASMAVVGCQGGASPDSAPEEDARVDGGGDVSSLPDADGAGEPLADDPRPGPITLVGATVEVLEDRLCDLDGDGVADNAIADLGAPTSSLLAAALGTTLQGLGELGPKPIFHFPWVDDLRGPDDPDTVAIAFIGDDVEFPDDTSDDLSGHEDFYPANSHLDACGEPRTFFQEARMEAGLVVASRGVLPLSMGMVVQGARFEGRIEPGGSSGEIDACGYATIAELGGVDDIDAEYTLLELLLLGGAGFGLPALPGVVPDVDVDGDGQERLTTDEHGFVTGCIDGDSTVIPGADCILDERIADGLSLNLSVTTVSCNLVGLNPNWQEVVTGTCDDPPEESLWGW